MNWMLNGIDILFVTLLVRACFFGFTDGREAFGSAPARSRPFRPALDGGSK
jgi:hypothetical protein